MVFGVGNGTTNDSAVHTTSLSLATWYFIQFYYNPSSLLIGIRLGTGSWITAATAGTIPNLGNTFRIGSMNTSTGAPNYVNLMDGTIDDLAFWRNRIPTDAEFNEIYNSGNGLSLSLWPSGGAERSYPRGVNRGIMGGVA